MAATVRIDVHEGLSEEWEGRRRVASLDGCKDPAATSASGPSHYPNTESIRPNDTGLHANPGVV